MAVRFTAAVWPKTPASLSRDEIRLIPRLLTADAEELHPQSFEIGSSAVTPTSLTIIYADIGRS